MADTNMNGVEDATENAQQEAEYKARAVSAKFKQQVSYGVGAAMVFGLVGAVATKLFTFAFPAQVAAVGAEAMAAGTVAAFSLPAILGLAALGVVGVGLLYLSAHYLAENTVLDQTMQAKQISFASKGKAQAVEQVVEPKVSNFPSAASAVAVDTAPTQTANDNNTVPQTSITPERSIADTIVARGAANENVPADKATASWSEKTTHTDEPTAAKARG